MRRYDWSFARTIEDLVLVEADPNDAREWLFSYEYPDDCAAIRRLLSLVGKDRETLNSKIEYEIARGTGLATALTISSVTKANPGVVTTSTAHGFAVGDTVISSNVVGMTQINDIDFQVVPISSTTYYMVDPDTGYLLNTTSYSTFTSGTVAKRQDSRIILCDLDDDTTPAPQVEFTAILDETDLNALPDYDDDYIEALSYLLAYEVCALVPGIDKKDLGVEMLTLYNEMFTNAVADNGMEESPAQQQQADWVNER